MLPIKIYNLLGNLLLNLISNSSIQIFLNKLYVLWLRYFYSITDFDWCSSGLTECPDDTNCVNKDFIFKCECKNGLEKIGCYDDAEHIDKCWSPILLTIVIILISIFTGTILIALSAVIILISYLKLIKKNQIINEQNTQIGSITKPVVEGNLSAEEVVQPKIIQVQNCGFLE